MPCLFKTRAAYFFLGILKRDSIAAENKRTQIVPGTTKRGVNRSNRGQHPKKKKNING